MHACIGRSVIYKHLTIFIGDPAIAKHHVRHITYPFLAFRRQKITCGFMEHLTEVMQICKEYVKRIAQSGRRIAYPMRHVQPAHFCFYWRRSQAILCFINGVVDAFIQYCFNRDFGVLYALRQAKCNPSTLSSLYEPILRTRVKSIFSVDKLRMKHYVALLGGIGLKI